MLTTTSPLPLNAMTANPARGFLRWLRLHRGAIAIAGLLAYAGPVTFFAGALSVLRFQSALEIAQLASWWLLYGAVLWLLLLGGGYLCEHVSRRAPRKVRAVPWLLAASMAAGLTSLLTAGRATMLLERGLIHSALTMHVHGFIFALLMALLYFAHLRRSHEHEQAAARLAVAQLAQREAQRRLVQSRLQEMQARIDPVLLFDLLDALRTLYQRDGPRAEHFLDELIAFLREALPRLRSASSSLLREAELARALVRLRALAEAAEDQLSIDVAPAARHARFPPGVLLPLLDGSAGERTGSCRLAATRHDAACRVVLSVATAPSDAAVTRVRALLAELHGPSAQLQIERRTDAIDVIVQVPYELA